MPLRQQTTLASAQNEKRRMSELSMGNSAVLCCCDSTSNDIFRLLLEQQAVRIARVFDREDRYEHARHHQRDCGPKVHPDALSDFVI